MRKEFTEKNPFSKRVYTLDKSILSIEATGIFRPRYEAKIPLKGIRHEKDTAYVRTDSKTAIFGVPGVILLFGTILLSEPIIKISVNLFYAGLAISVLTVFIGFFFAEKSKAFIYHYDSGAVAFDISQSGNFTENFESFCRDIETTIEKCNQKA